MSERVSEILHDGLFNIKADKREKARKSDRKAVFITGPGGRGSNLASLDDRVCQRVNLKSKYRRFISILLGFDLLV